MKTGYYYVDDFKCPQCGDGGILERSINIIAFNVVHGFQKRDDWIVSDIDAGMNEELDYDSSYPDEYSCANCGMCIGRSSDEALQWLIDHNMVKWEDK
jgi:predicted RNA-binding Zn-ribbon protein involved in translation (DUF1610 family)